VLDGLEALLIVEPRGYWPRVHQLNRGVLFAFGLHYRLADLLAQRAELLYPILWTGLRTACGVGWPPRGAGASFACAGEAPKLGAAQRRASPPSLCDALCATVIVPEPLLPGHGLARLFVASSVALLAALDKRNIGVVGGALEADVLEVIDLITACDLSPHLLLDFCVTRSELQGRRPVEGRHA
jgi:hypothetical protein